MATNYHIAFKDVEGISWDAQIEDITAPPGTPTVVELQPAGEPIVLKAINNSEDKFSPIRATECVLRFVSESVSLMTFAGSEDNRWKVTVTKGGSVVFVGFLALDDLEEPLRRPVRIITLRATDNLGSLKDKVLVDFSGEKFYGVYSIITYISMALVHTGLRLPINIASSVKVKRGDTYLPFFEACYVDSIRFNTLSSEAARCYDVLTALLGNRFYITQHAGEWWVVDIDNMEESPIPVRSYTYEGEYDSNGTLSKSDILYQLAEDIGNLKLQRPVKRVSLGFEYRKTLPLLNQEYRDGSLAPALNIMGEMGSWDDFQRSYKTYNAFGWSFYEIHRTAGTIVPVTDANKARAGIRRLLYSGTEASRQLFLHQRYTYNTRTDWLLENDARILVKNGNIVTASIDCRYPDGFLVNSEMYCCQIVLVGYDGSKYTLDYQGAWQTTSNPVSGNYLRVKDIANWTNGGNGTESPARFEIKSNPAPVDGNLIFRLVHFVSELPEDLMELWAPRTAYYSNIDVNVIPSKGFINDSIKWRYTIDQSGEYGIHAEYNTTIDSSIALTGGRLLVEDDNVNNMYGYNTPSGFSTGTTDYIDYGEMLCVGMWNQANRVMSKTEVSCNRHPDPTTLYILPEVPSKRYMLLGYEYKCRENKCTMNLVEVYDNTIGKDSKTVTKEVVIS